MYIRFSDNDEHLQAYQIKNLVDNGIGILIVSAKNTSAVIREAVEYASANEVMVISYDTLIADTEAVDFYIAFDTSSVDRVDSETIVDMDAVKAMFAGEAESAWVFDSALLAKKCIELAVEFQNKKPLRRHYKTVDNGSREVLYLYIEPAEIEESNYRQLIIDSGILSEDKFNDLCGC